MQTTRTSGVIGEDCTLILILYATIVLLCCNEMMTYSVACKRRKETFRISVKFLKTLVIYVEFILYAILLTFAWTLPHSDAIS